MSDQSEEDEQHAAEEMQGPPGSTVYVASSEKLDYSLVVNTDFHNEKIEVELRKATELLSRTIIDTREKAIREFLIRLGWTPPEPKPLFRLKHVEDPEPPPCCSCGHFISNGTDTSCPGCGRAYTKAEMDGPPVWRAKPVEGP